MPTIGDSYPKKHYDSYKNRPFIPDFQDRKTDFFEKENVRLKNELEKAYKKINELESKLKLFDESLLTTSKSTRDTHKDIYISSIELKNERIQSLEKQIGELKEKHEKEIAELQNKFEIEKKQELTFLKEHNAFMSELLDERKSGWIIRRDLAIRTNPVPDEPNKFGFPLDFDENKVHNLQDSGLYRNWCHFKYFYNNDFPDGKYWNYDMPWSCYEFLSGRLEIDKKINKEKKNTVKKTHTKKYNSPDLLIQYFKEQLGKKFYKYTLLSITIDFLFEKGKVEFGWEDIANYCKEKHNKKPVSATVHKHLKLLIEHEIISREYHGVYEVNKLLINFD